MKIKNKKYILATVLISLLGGCGSGGGGGSTGGPSPKNPKVHSSGSIPAPVASSKPKETEKKPVKKEEVLVPEKDVKVEIEPKEVIKEEVIPKKNNGKMVVEHEGQIGLVAEKENEVAINEKNGEIKVTKVYSSGMGAFGKNTRAVNEGKIIGDQSKDKPGNQKGMDLMTGMGGGNLENKGSLQGKGYDIVGMNSESRGEGFTSVNKGTIELNGYKSEENATGLHYADLVGMKGIKRVEKDGIDENIKLQNDGKIKIDYKNFHLDNPNARSSENLVGMLMEVENSNDKNVKNEMINGATGTIEVNGNYGTGMEGIGKNIRMGNNGNIKVDGTFAYGMKANGENVIGINSGTIEEGGKYGSLMWAENGGTVINNGKLETKNNKMDGSEFDRTGIYATDKGYGKNGKDGEIILTGYSDIGMKAYGKNSILENSGKIITKSQGNIGMLVSGEDVVGINNGTINIEGTSTVGMLAIDKGLAINEGKIIMGEDGNDNTGMMALDGGTIVNGEKGIIEINGRNSSGLYIRGKESKLLNLGTITVKGKDNKDISENIKDGTIVQKGQVDIVNGILEIGKNAKLEIGKRTDGQIPKIRARRGAQLNVQGEIVGAPELINNKAKTVYENVIEVEDGGKVLGLNRMAQPVPLSLLAKSVIVENKDGNYNLEISKDKNNVENVIENKEYLNIAREVVEYEEDVLDGGEKDQVLKTVLGNNDKKNLNKIIKDLSGQIYTNVPRQIFDINENFLKEDTKLIDNLGEYGYNFNFFGGKNSVKNKGEISGYKKTYEGFVGSKKIGDNLYTTLGYENGNIKYNEKSKGSIKSIHTGLYKKLSLNKMEIRLGANGEYNFHETTRTIESFNKTGKSKFNSYAVGINGEISRRFGDNLYIEPTMGLKTTYGTYENIKEKNAGALNVNIDSEKYLSILPNVNLKVGKKFAYSEIYTNINYSYELGDLNKEQDMSIFNNGIKYGMKKDSLEKDSLNINGGVKTEINNFNVSFEIGKEIGKRENSYMTVGFGYKFANEN